MSKPRTLKPIAMPAPLDLAIQQVVLEQPDDRIALAAWRGGEALHGRLIESCPDRVVIECAGIRFAVPRPIKKSKDQSK